MLKGVKSVKQTKQVDTAFGQKLQDPADQPQIESKRDPAAAAKVNRPSGMHFKTKNIQYGS